MSLDLFIKLAALLGGGVATWRVIVELLRGRHGSRREEYAFARKFLKELNDEPFMHPYLKQKGLQAIAKDDRLTSGEIEHLLGLHDPVRALNDYSLGRPYLVHLSTADEKQFAFKTRYESPWTRRWRKVAYFALYLVSYALAVAPLYLPQYHLLPLSQALTMFPLTAAIFFPAAFLALRAAIRVLKAEDVVRYQRRSSQRVVFAES